MPRRRAAEPPRRAATLLEPVMADWIEGNVKGAYEAYYHNINPEPFGQLVGRPAPPTL